MSAKVGVVFFSGSAEQISSLSDNVDVFNHVGYRVYAV